MARRLAAILAADIAGYSLLVEADEDGTIRALKGHMSAIQPLIGLNNGRIVKTMGDGFLAEFPSVVEAVACGETIQKRIADRNSVSESPKMAFRIGIHVGDIIASGDDILGDGVNIAARLEGLAEPGGIVVSGRVKEDVEGKLDLTFRELGQKYLKNISRPVRAFSVAVEGTLPATQEPSRPGKPSVAVLAFDNLSSDPEQDYFADGITEDIITGLSRIPWIFVIARNSSFSYKGLSMDIRKIGSELGVRYVLEGSVRKSGKRVRVTGQLVDAETGNHIWVNRFDGLVEDIFDLQDQITEAVVGAIAPEIRAAEIERISRKRSGSTDAYDQYLRAQAALNRFALHEADRHLERAERLSPGFSSCTALRAWLRTILWHPDARLTEDSRSEACSLAWQVLNAADADIEARAYAGYTLAYLSDEYEFGLSQVAKAVEECPNCISAWGSSCILNALQGKTEMAIQHGREALRLSPKDPMSYRVHIGLLLAHAINCDWASVLEAVEPVRAFFNSVQGFRLFEIAARHHVGEIARAEKLAEQHMALNPEFTVAQFRENRTHVHAVRPGGYEPIFIALLASGIPEY